MMTHDYLLRIAAEERYARLLQNANLARRLRRLGNVSRINISIWAWLRQWFPHRWPAFGLTKMKIGF